MEYLIVGFAALVIAMVSHWHFRHTKRKGHRVSGAAAGAFAVLDEVFHPNAHQAQQIQEVQRELPAPAPLPGDGDKGIYRGRIQIAVESAQP